MTRNVISSTDAVSLINKVISESIPLTASVASGDGIKALLRGFARGIGEGSLVITVEPSPPTSMYLSFPLGTSALEGCECVFGDSRELHPDMREEAVGKLGEAVLSITRPEGSRLTLFFTP